MHITPIGPMLYLNGAFDARSTWDVRHAVYDHIESHGDVVIDLTDVTAVDAIALRVLAYATRRAQERGHRLTLRGCGPSVRRMLHLSKLYALCDVERVAQSA